MTTSNDKPRQVTTKEVENAILPLTLSADRKQTARLRELLPLIDQATQQGVTLIAIHQKLQQLEFTVSYKSFTKILSRLRQNPRPAPLTSPAPPTRPEYSPTRAASSKPGPDFDQPGITDKQRREALADYFCDPSKNLHPLVKKAMEKTK